MTGVLQEILSIAILKGSITAAEGRAIMDQVKANTQVSSRHRREHFSSSRGDVGLDGDRTPTVVDGDDDDDDDDVDQGLESRRQQQQREDSEAATGRVVYGSSGVRSGNGAGLAISRLVNIPGAHLGRNRFIVDLNEASVNPSAASLDVLARAFDELAMFDEFLTADE